MSPCVRVCVCCCLTLSLVCLTCWLPATANCGWIFRCSTLPSVLSWQTHTTKTDRQKHMKLILYDVHPKIVCMTSKQCCVVSISATRPETLRLKWPSGWFNTLRIFINAIWVVTVLYEQLVMMIVGQHSERWRCHFKRMICTSALPVYGLKLPKMFELRQKWCYYQVIIE